MERKRGGCLSKVSFTWPVKGLCNGILKGVFSWEDGLYAIWSYRGFCFIHISWGYLHLWTRPLLFPLLFYPSSFFSFFSSLYLSFFFFFSSFLSFLSFFFFIKFLKIYIIVRKGVRIFRDTPAAVKPHSM